MPTTIPLASRCITPGLAQATLAQTSNLDFVLVAAFAVTGLLLSFAFAWHFPISTDVAPLMASVS
jgi:hypothetical protein